MNKLIKAGAGWNVPTKKGNMISLTIGEKRFIVFPNGFKKPGTKMPDFIAYEGNKKTA